jgi:hypothetical protein
MTIEGTNNFINVTIPWVNRRNIEIHAMKILYKWVYLTVGYSNGGISWRFVVNFIYW